MLSNKTNLLEEADRLAVQSALSSSTIDSSDNSLLQDQVDSIEETIIYLNTSMVSLNTNNVLIIYSLFYLGRNERTSVRAW